MKNNYENCVFCNEDLTREEKKGRGEHVIPKSLLGSFCMKDVCSECNNTLGSQVDHLALEDERIIEAVSLDPPRVRSALLPGRSRTQSPRIEFRVPTFRLLARAPLPCTDAREMLLAGMATPVAATAPD